MIEIGSELRCPAGCVDCTPDQIKATTRESLGIPAERAGAARLESDDGLFICTRCGCFWRRLFDSYILRYRTIILGTSTPLTRFCPAPWLNRVLSVDDDAEALAAAHRTLSDNAGPMNGQ